MDTAFPADDLGAVLAAALRRYPEVAREPARCRAVLNDLVGADAIARRQEITLLVAAVEAGVPDALLASDTDAVFEGAVAELATTSMVATDLARRTVRTWAHALGRGAGGSKPGVPQSDPADAGRAGDTGPARAPVGKGAVLEPTWTDPDESPRQGGDLDDLRRKESEERKDPSPTEPVETNVHRGLDRTRALVAAAGIAAVVVIGVAVLALSGGSDDEPKERAVKSTATSESTFSSGVSVTRVVTVDPRQSLEYKLELTIRNTTGTTAAYFLTEAVPKAVGTTSGSVQVVPTATVIQEQPLVMEFVGGLAPRATTTVTMDGNLDHRLATDRAARNLMRQAADEQERYVQAHPGLQVRIVGGANCKTTDNCYYYGAINSNSSAATGSWNVAGSSCNTATLPYPPPFINFDKFRAGSCTITLTVRDPTAGTVTKTATVTFVP